jgi:hypothetical protein
MVASRVENDGFEIWYESEISAESIKMLERMGREEGS